MDAHLLYARVFPSLSPTTSSFSSHATCPVRIHFVRRFDVERVSWRKTARRLHSYAVSYRWLCSCDSTIGTEEAWGLEPKIMYINHVFVSALPLKEWTCKYVCVLECVRACSCVLEDERWRNEDICVHSQCQQPTVSICQCST